MPAKSLTRRMQILRPWLEKDDWAAMTYMLIPHVLKEAEQLRIDLVSKPSRESKAERDRLLKEVQSLMVARAERVRRRQQAASKDKSV
jgi:DNA-directed RNA polymerase subunit L